jgi:short-subunit dehydrogenase
MKLTGSRILLTGASGGIGTSLALELARRGAALALLARDEHRLRALATRVRELGVTCVTLPFDLAASSGHAEVVAQAASALGGLDVLINNAGVQCFGALRDENPAAITQLVAINVTAPLLLTRAALAHFHAGGAGHVVNVGSTFGAIGHPLFAAYSASKFALRGFSEALRRELSADNIEVIHVSPRATDTAMNDGAVRRMQAMTGTRVDAPQAVAKAVVDALESGTAERQLGRPERFFVRLNALLPRLVDRALSQQARTISPTRDSGAAANRL